MFRVISILFPTLFHLVISSNKVPLKGLGLLLDRPWEPVIEVKDEGRVLLDIPQHFLTPQHQMILKKRYPNGVSAAAVAVKIKVKNITIPHLAFPLSLDRQDRFSIFNPEHQKMAAQLIQAYFELPTPEDVFSLAVYLHDRVNPLLGVYALTVATINHHGTRGMQYPLLSTVFPDRFVDSESMGRLSRQGKIVEESCRSVAAVNKQPTASYMEEEQKLFYFREDLGVNLHHWHWHLVYPGAPLSVATKDRRGELFYYMHQQIIARYNFERIGNRLDLVKSLNDLRRPLKEGYFSKLNDRSSSANWPGRPSSTTLNDLNREKEKLKVDIHDMERWKARILNAIDRRAYVGDDGVERPLDNGAGIDILGNIVESTDLSKNKNFYGNYHNQGHNLIAFAHDPDGRYLEHPGVMAETETAMRDPAFYRWHSEINQIFWEHKSILRPYTDEELNFNNIYIKSATLMTGQKKNVLQTKWNFSVVDIAKGLDFMAKGKVLANFTHLQHDSFSYEIEVFNWGYTTKGTCRIFLAPKSDGRGLSIPFHKHVNHFIEMDKFVVTLRSGINKIERNSSESSVIIPFNRTFPNINNTNQKNDSDICRCGWPEHMLVPRGTKDGLACWLFVMISDYEDDRVEMDAEPPRMNDGVSYCGVRDRKYPDRRAMGFPFDRLPSSDQDSLELFADRSNMKTTNVTIHFSGQEEYGFS